MYAQNWLWSIRTPHPHKVSWGKACSKWSCPAATQMAWEDTNLSLVISVVENGVVPCWIPDPVAKSSTTLAKMEASCWHLGNVWAFTSQIRNKLSKLKVMQISNIKKTLTGAHANTVYLPLPYMPERTLIRQMQLQELNWQYLQPCYKRWASSVKCILPLTPLLNPKTWRWANCAPPGASCKIRNQNGPLAQGEKNRDFWQVLHFWNRSQHTTF